MIESLIYTAIEAAFHAGEAILEVYSDDFAVDYKIDSSPITIADRKAHQIISGYLEESGIPILSEEGSEIPYSQRKDWKTFWLVDPLDGTKEFVNRNGDFTVNIALIQDQIPIAGVIYAPVPDLLYFTVPGKGAFKINGKYLIECKVKNIHELLERAVLLPEKFNSAEFVVVASRSHQNPQTTEYIKTIKSEKEIRFLSVGSSLKFCAVAEGSADLYPRLGPTMEWDTAAGQAIACNAGCLVKELFTDQPVKYNKESLLNPFFVVERK